MTRAEFALEIEALQEKLKARENELAALRTAGEKTAARLAAEAETERLTFAKTAAQFKQRNRILEQRISSLQRSTSYRLGHAVVRGLKFPTLLWKIFKNKNKKSSSIKTLIINEYNLEDLTKIFSQDKGKSLKVKSRRIGQTVRTQSYPVSFEVPHAGWGEIEITLTRDGANGRNDNPDMALLFGAMARNGSWMPFSVTVGEMRLTAGPAGLAALHIPLDAAEALRLTTPEWPREAERLWIGVQSLAPGPFIEVAANRVLNNSPADFGSAIAERIEALASRDDVAGAEAVLYADIDLNVIDGSSIWLSSMASILARHRRVLLVAKRNIKTDVVVANIENRDRVTILEPRHFDHVRSHFDLDEATKVLRGLDANCPSLTSVFVRGMDAATELLRDRQFHDRLYAYPTDFYEICDHGTRIPENRARELVVLATHARQLLVQTRHIAAQIRTATNMDFKFLELPPPIPDNLPIKPPHTISRSSLRIGYAGKIAPDWGVRELLDWADILRTEGQELELTIIGNKISGPKTAQERQAFREDMVRRMRDGGVIRYEQLNRAEVLAQLREMDFVWCWRPASFEQKTLELSTKLVEGVASGFACICFPSEINLELLGEDYPYFAENLDDVRRLLDSETVGVPQEIVTSCREKHSLTVLADRIAASLPAAEAKATPRICFAGHDFKFIDPYISRLKLEGWQVTRDPWDWGAPLDMERSQALSRDADIVFCEWGLANAVWYSNNLLHGKRLFVRIHLQEINDRAQHLARNIDLHAVERFIFVSERVRSVAMQLYGWPEEKSVTIPNFVLDEEYAFHERPFDGPIRLGMVGIVPWRKRFDHAVDLLAALRLRGHAAELHIKGPRPETLPYMRARGRREEFGKYEAQYERLRQNPDLERAVIFHSPGNDVAAFYRKVDHILSPSDFESFHYALADGVLSGCHPVVWPWEEADTIYDPDWIVRSVNEAAERISAFRQLSAVERSSSLARNRSFVCDRYGVKNVFRKLDSLLSDTDRDTFFSQISPISAEECL